VSTHDRLTYAIDCISTPTSVGICKAAMGSQGGTHVTTQISTPWPSLFNIKIINMSPFTALGKPFSVAPGGWLIPAVQEHRSVAEAMIPIVEDLLQHRKLVSHAFEVRTVVYQGRWMESTTSGMGEYMT